MRNRGHFFFIINTFIDDNRQLLFKCHHLTHRSLGLCLLVNVAQGATPVELDKELVVGGSGAVDVDAVVVIGVA